MREAIQRLKLDLHGLRVLTEAATGSYIVTPIICALAGAEEVIAVTADSRYGKGEDVRGATLAFAEQCGARFIRVTFRKETADISRADIMTNLGFVRPIDEALIRALHPKAVVVHMCEPWEIRPGDVDFRAIRRHGIPMMAVNEDAPGVEVFDSVGTLAAQMLLSLEVELRHSRLVVAGSDKFAGRTSVWLGRTGALVTTVSSLCSEEARKHLSGADGLVIADYTCEEVFIGPGGQIGAGELAALSPGIAVVQLAGAVDAVSLRQAGLPFAPPDATSAPHRMGRTLAALGPRPVIDLHTAGLKVGEALRRGREQGLEGESLLAYTEANAPASRIHLPE